MSDVQRYFTRDQEPASDGLWVLASDYDALACEVEALHKQLDEEMQSHAHTKEALDIQVPAYEQRSQELERQLAEADEEITHLQSAWGSERRCTESYFDVITMQAERLEEAQHRCTELEHLLGLEMAKVVGHRVMREQAEARIAELTNLEGKPQCWKVEHIDLEARLAELGKQWDALTDVLIAAEGDDLIQVVKTIIEQRDHASERLAALIAALERIKQCVEVDRQEDILNIVEVALAAKGWP